MPPSLCSLLFTQVRKHAWPSALSLDDDTEAAQARALSLVLSTAALAREEELKKQLAALEAARKEAADALNDAKNRVAEAEVLHMPVRMCVGTSDSMQCPQASECISYSGSIDP